MPEKDKYFEALAVTRICYRCFESYSNVWITYGFLNLSQTFGTSVYYSICLQSENGPLALSGRPPPHITPGVFCEHKIGYSIIGHARYNNILQCFNTTPRLSGQTSIFGVVFFVSKSLLGIERQKKLKKITISTRKPGTHVRILRYRT